MSSERKCPACGRPLAADAPEELCPACLIKAGFGTGILRPFGRARGARRVAGAFGPPRSFRPQLLTPFMKPLTLIKLLSPSLSMGLVSAALVLASSTQATAQEYTFTTLAGPPELGPGDADGPASLARFGGPYGVAVDSAGNVYVADSINHTIRLGRPACPDAPTIDLVTGPVDQAHQLDTSPQTAVAWQWRLVRVPATSATASWTANVRNPTFTPDVPDLFIFRLTATNATGAIGIRTLAFTAVDFNPQLRISTGATGKVTITWTTGTLVSSPTADGDYAPVANATSPYEITPPSPGSMFYRVKQ